MAVTSMELRPSAITGEAAISALGVAKRFGGTVALDGIDFMVSRGEVHGLVGKNGAGKSTFLKILSGALHPDAGKIVVGGRAFDALTPLEARRAGIAAVYQNPELHLDLSVAENIFLGSEPLTRWGLVDDATMTRRAQALLERLGLSVPAASRLGDLDLALRQQVAIAKAVREDASVLLLDEPTSALNAGQVEFLFQLIRNLARGGMAIVYISHHLDEVLAIADRITVFRDGRQVDAVDALAIDKAGLIAKMVGHSVDAAAPRAESRARGNPLLSVAGLSVPGRLIDVSLAVDRREIVGLTGLTGAGARTLASVMGGVVVAAGAMTLLGAPYAPASVEEAIRRGVVFVPEDIRARGLVMPMSVAHNITLAKMKALSRFFWLDLKRELAEAAAAIDRFGIVPRDPDREVEYLSGGNQRKTLLGRALFTSATLLVLEEPTQGVDVDARRQIHEHLRRLADCETAVVFVSTDLEELIGLADRIVVLRNGRIGQELSPAGLSPDRLLSAIQNQELEVRMNDV